MGTSAGKTQTTSTTSLPAFQQPYVEGVMSEAKRLYDSSGPNYYPGQTVAGFTGAQTLGQNFLQDTAGQQAAYNATQVQPSLTALMNAYDVKNNPTVAAAAEAAMRPVKDALMQEVLPGIRSGSVLSGTLGGSRQALAEGTAIGKATQAMADSTAGMYNNAYLAGLQALSSGLGLAPTIQQNAYLPGQVLTSVGETQQQQSQNEINAAMQKWAYEQALPYQKLVELSNLVNGSYGGQGTSSVTGEGGGTTQTIGSIMSGIGLIPYLWDLFS